MDGVTNTSEIQILRDLERFMFKIVLLFFVPMCVQVLCARIEDEPRFRAMIDSWIQDGSVPEFPAYSGAFRLACTTTAG